ncbi:MAG TPA: lanthionine synthetase LanC family protein, partial [Candidatus Saccharimonadales bacterium]|nr:lanthionine synthetase LanC family protein [Candidatus Saccharimonadales bacterium]
QVGIVTTLATYYERLKASDPARAAKCKQYAKAGANFIEHVRDRLDDKDGDSRALPEIGTSGEDGETNMNSGYLSGTAGSAFMNLKLYQAFDDEKYLTNAKDNLEWLQDTEDGPMVEFDDGSVAWKLAVDNQDEDAKDNHDLLPTGFEEGAAGIGWTFLQAYKVTGEKKYLETASKAAKWLGSDNVAIKSDKGWSWNEGQGHGEAKTKNIIHANLNNGAAGVGMFAGDLAAVTGDKAHKALSDNAVKGLRSSAKGTKDVYWKDNSGDFGDNYQNDPSAHWGKAGIVIYLARITGGKADAPGLHDALQKQ